MHGDVAFVLHATSKLQFHNKVHTYSLTILVLNKTIRSAEVARFLALAWAQFRTKF